MRLTLPQFEAFQAFACERLAKQEMADGLGGVFKGKATQAPAPAEDNTDQFAAAALRLKEKQGVKASEKINIPIGKVWEEMKHGG